MAQATRIIRFPNTMQVPTDHPKLLVADIADDFDRGNSASLEVYSSRGEGMD